MAYKTLKQKVAAIKKGTFTALENVMHFSKKIATPETKFMNIFLELNEDAIEQAKRIDVRIKNCKKVGKLAGLCFAVKSNISVKGLETNCASKVLEGYVSPYNASVINKLLSEDAIVLGMVNMDEFACGASGETSSFGKTLNPRNQELITGGSSSGSAAAVAADLCDFALGSDTGGSIRNPASHCGVVGLKPTYGAVSRYGLIDMCMSFDCIGPLAHNVQDSKMVLDVIKGQDHFDCTTSDSKEKVDSGTQGVPHRAELSKGKTIGLVDVKDFTTLEIAELIETKTRELAKKNDWKIVKVKLPLDISLETYYLLVYVEFFSGTRKFDGRRFGKGIDKFGGPEVQRRILGGSEITKAEFEGRYYNEALKSKAFIAKEFEKIFSKVDVIVLPTVPKPAHKFTEKLTVEEMYAYDVFTVLANIAGIPAVSIPVGLVDGKDVGIQLMADKWNDDLLLDYAKVFGK